MNEKRKYKLLELWCDKSINNEEAEELLRYLETSEESECKEILNSYKLAKTIYQFYKPVSVHYSEKIIDAIRTDSEHSKMTDTVMSALENLSTPKLEKSKQNSELKTKKSNKNNKGMNILFSIAASVAVIATVLFFSIPSNTVGKVVLSSKGATIIRDNRILSPKNFSDLKIGDIIETNDDFSMAYEDNTLIDIKKNSKIIVQGTSSEKKLYLEKGAIFATVKPQNKNNPFIIVTPNGNVEVIGTAFDLQATENQTKIRVKKGKVKFGKEKSIILTAGEVASFAKDKLNYYGLMSNEGYLNIDNPILFNLDFSKKMPEDIRFHGEIQPFGHAKQKVAVSKSSNQHTGVFYYPPNNPLISLSTDMVVHVTLKTNTIDGLFELGLLNTVESVAKNPKRFGISLRKWLEKDKLNKWQTISLPVKKGNVTYYNKEADIMKEKFGTNQHLFLAKYIRLSINNCKDGQLQISRVWITR